MMRGICQWAPCCLLALVTSVFVPAAREACAQTSDRGPTRDALAPTAASLLGSAPTPAVGSVWIRHRSDAFQDDFTADFGVARPLEKGEVVDHLRGEVAARWGDTRLYEWVRTGLALYARFQTLTEARHSGFDMEVSTDELTEGKVGLRVSRALE